MGVCSHLFCFLFGTGGGWVGMWDAHSNRSPKCGILSSKLLSPVCKERSRRRRWGCCSVRAVSVWPVHVTCLLLRAMAVAKKQVVMAVVRAVSWCMRWCGEVRSRGAHRQMHWAVYPPVPVVSSASQKREPTPRFVFPNMPECKTLFRASVGGVGARECEIWSIKCMPQIYQQSGQKSCK